MQVFINYPKNDKDIKIFLNNLALFKAELLLKSIEDTNTEKEIQDEILNKILEILNDNNKNVAI